MSTTKNRNKLENPTPYPAGLILSAIGVVYGDLDTSPLYTMQEIFTGSHAVTPTPENVLGILSLIFWSLIIVVSLKYVFL